MAFSAKDARDFLLPGLSAIGTPQSVQPPVQWFTALVDMPSYYDTYRQSDFEAYRRRQAELDQWCALQGMTDFLPGIPQGVDFRSTDAAAAPPPVEPSSIKPSSPPEPPTDPDARRFAVLDFD